MGETTQSGLYKNMMEVFNADKKALWTHLDLMEELDIPEQAATNGAYYLYRDGKVKRHVGKCPETGKFRYAVSIAAGKDVPYVKGMSNKPSMNAMKMKTRKKGQLPTAREVRTMFAQTQNQMAKMEDMMIAVVEEYEELEKMINKIKNITS